MVGCAIDILGCLGLHVWVGSQIIIVRLLYIAIVQETYISPVCGRGLNTSATPHAPKLQIVFYTYRKVTSMGLARYSNNPVTIHLGL